MVFVMHTSRAAGHQLLEVARPIATRSCARPPKGEHLSTLALSEKGSRSQFWAPVSQLAAKGDGFVASATKSWVTSANFADSYVSSAQAPDATSPLESTIYLARTGAAEVRPQGAFDGLGLRGNDSSPVSLENLPVSRAGPDQRAGQGCRHDAGRDPALVRRRHRRHGARPVPRRRRRHARHLSSAAFEHTGTLLRDLPQLRARLAQMSVRTEASRALLGRTLGEMEAGSPEAPLFVLSARRAALEAALEVTDLALKACGGAAFSRQATPIERLFRDARAGWVMAPTVDHLDDFIGKALTGLPLF